ncbi:MAG: helix-turn-helix domain-containing protein, partial [Bacteroidota bacterium]
DIRVSDVQKNLDVSAQELSAALRKNGFENFNAFLNQTRVREVQRRFENPEFDHYSVEAIAKDAGFGSRTSFYRAFETVTGVRPAYYRSQIRRNTDQ